MKRGKHNYISHCFTKIIYGKNWIAVDKICDKLNLRVPTQKKIIENLKKMGFEAVLTHFNNRGIKTNASAEKVKEVIRKLVFDEN